MVGFHDVRLDKGGIQTRNIIKVLGYEYTVEKRDDAFGLDAFGKCNFKSQTMPIASDLAPEQARSTILHEIIEALNYHLDLKMKHDTIMRLEAGLYQTLVDNGVSLSKLGE